MRRYSWAHYQHIFWNWKANYLKSKFQHFSCVRFISLIFLTYFRILQADKENATLQTVKENRILLSLCIAFALEFIMFIVLAATSSDSTPDVNLTVCSIRAGFTHYFILLTAFLTVMYMYSVHNNGDKKQRCVLLIHVWGKKFNKQIDLRLINLGERKNVTRLFKCTEFNCV